MLAPWLIAGLLLAGLVPDGGTPVLEVAFPTANVRTAPSASAPVIGLLPHGTRISSFDCEPADGGCRWLRLSREAYLAASVLQPASAPDPRHERVERFVWAKVLGPSAIVRAAPEPHARVLARLARGKVIALWPDAALQARGWLPRPDVGYVKLEGLRIDRPSAFAGVAEPTAPLAFAWRATELAAENGRFPVPRLSHFTAVAVASGRVLTSVGELPRSAVRIAVSRPRPAQVPPSARWVHINLDEQVLTAYEGDRWVYATLVSTGRPDRATDSGIYRAWYKGLHDLMHDPGEYYVEEVPYVLYFHRGQALHGAFWHDRFGQAVTHGCVNLSLADAAWLFRWAPPALPEGWHSRITQPGEDALWVVVEHAGATALPPRTALP